MKNPITRINTEKIIERKREELKVVWNSLSDPSLKFWDSFCAEIEDIPGSKIIKIFIMAAEAIQAP